MTSAYSHIGDVIKVLNYHDLFIEFFYGNLLFIIIIKIYDIELVPSISFGSGLIVKVLFLYKYLYLNFSANFSY